MKQYLVKVDGAIKGVFNTLAEAESAASKHREYYENCPGVEVTVVGCESTIRLIHYQYADYMDFKPSDGYCLMDPFIAKEWCETMNESAWSGSQWIKKVYNTIDEITPDVIEGIVNCGENYSAFIVDILKSYR